MKTLVLFGLCVLTANAGEFARAKASADSSGNLTVSWRETGLQPRRVYDYRAQARAAANYWCLEIGVRHPAGNKLDTVTSENLQSTDSFTSSNAGTVSGELVLTPPPANASCDPGYKLVLHDVTYWNVVLGEEFDPFLTVEIPGEYGVLMFGRTTGQSSR